MADQPSRTGRDLTSGGAGTDLPMSTQPAAHATGRAAMRATIPGPDNEGGC